MNLFYVLVLGIALSIDGFIAGMAYGLRNIRMPFASLIIVCIITVLCTETAMACAAMLGNFIDPHIAIMLGSLLLILIGMVSLFQEYLTKNVTPYQSDGDVTARKLTFSIGRLVISIMTKPETADVDHSQRISSLEAIFLGLALGVDNMVATFAAALMGSLPLYTPVVMGLVQVIVFSSGVYASTRFVPERLKNRFPYLPGAILIILGLLRIL
jgi:putative sporulation protein YtaF